MSVDEIVSETMDLAGTAVVSQMQVELELSVPYRVEQSVKPLVLWVMPKRDSLDVHTITDVYCKALESKADIRLVWPSALREERWADALADAAKAAALCVLDLREYPMSYIVEILRRLNKVIWVYTTEEWVLERMGWREASMVSAARASIFPSYLALRKAQERAGRLFPRAHVFYPLPDVSRAEVRRGRKTDAEGGDKDEAALWREGADVWVGDDFDGSEAPMLAHGKRDKQAVLYVAGGEGRYQVENFSDEVQVVLDDGVLYTVDGLARVLYGNEVWAGVPKQCGWKAWNMPVAIARLLKLPVHVEGEIGAMEFDVKEAARARERMQQELPKVVLGEWECERR